MLLSATYFRKEQQCVILLFVSCNACHLSESVVKVKKLMLMALSFVLRNKNILKSEARVVMLSIQTIMEKPCCSHY